MKNKKNSPIRQAATGVPPESNKSALSLTSAGLNPIGNGGTVALAGEKSVLSREKVVDVREEVVDLREETADMREKVLRDQGGAARSKAARAERQLNEANVNLAIAVVQAQTMTDAAEQAAAQMAHMAEHDFLTGLPNRTLLADRLVLSIALAKRHDKKVALLHLDLDHFKHVNNRLGQAVGDKLLQSVCRQALASGHPSPGHRLPPRWRRICGVAG